MISRDVCHFRCVFVCYVIRELHHIIDTVCDSSETQCHHQKATTKQSGTETQHGTEQNKMQTEENAMEMAAACHWIDEYVNVISF